MIQQIAKEYVGPVLKSHGFKKSGLTWNRMRGEFVDVIELQSAKYSTSAEQSITGNVALCVPEFRKIVFPNLQSAFSSADGLVRIRFGELAINNAGESVLDRWWEVTPDNISTVGSELRQLVSERVLPFLEPFIDYRVIIRFMECVSGWLASDATFQLYKALAYWKTGDLAKCEAAFAAVNPGWADKVLEVRRRISAERVV